MHSYFSPLGSPIEAFTIYSSILSDLEARVMLELQKPEWVARRMLRPFPAERAFTFFYEFARPTQTTVYSIEEFSAATSSVDVKSIEFHTERGDFERWIRHVMGDTLLADKLKEMGNQISRGEALRKKTASAVDQRIKELKAVAKGTT